LGRMAVPHSVLCLMRITSPFSSPFCSQIVKCDFLVSYLHLNYKSPASHIPFHNLLRRRMISAKSIEAGFHSSRTDCCQDEDQYNLQHGMAYHIPDRVNLLNMSLATYYQASAAPYQACFLLPSTSRLIACQHADSQTTTRLARRLIRDLSAMP
jgi:hypothetical protein